MKTHYYILWHPVRGYRPTTLRTNRCHSWRAIEAYKEKHWRAMAKKEGWKCVRVVVAKVVRGKR